MSNYVMCPMTGSIGKNKHKVDGDKKPDITGKFCLPDGTLCWLSGWKKTFDDGGVIYNLKATPCDERAQAAPAQAAPQDDGDSF